MDDSLERAVLIYTTFPSIGEAEQVGQTLIERRLCACVNILPGMVSLYWWHGAIERGNEVVMIIKTRAALAEPVREAVRKLHSYTTPAFLVIALESVQSFKAFCTTGRFWNMPFRPPTGDDTW